MAGASAQQSEQRYEPSATLVAVLPVINLSGEKDARFKAEQVKAASEALHKQFSDRGFRLVDDRAVEDAAAAAKVDLTDEEQHTRSTILSLGAAVKADLVVFVVIERVWSKGVTKFFTVTSEGHAKVNTWLIRREDPKSDLERGVARGEGGAGRLYRPAEVQRSHHSCVRGGCRPGPRRPAEAVSASGPKKGPR